jgi:hypothetical protein
MLVSVAVVALIEVPVILFVTLSVLAAMLPGYGEATPGSYIRQCCCSCTDRGCSDAIGYAECVRGDIPGYCQVSLVARLLILAVTVLRELEAMFPVTVRSPPAVMLVSVAVTALIELADILFVTVKLPPAVILVSVAVALMEVPVILFVTLSVLAEIFPVVKLPLVARLLILAVTVSSRSNTVTVRYHPLSVLH